MKTIIPSEIQQLALETYRDIRQKVAGDVPVTLLHIDGEYSFMAQGSDLLNPEGLWVFEIGIERTALEYFKNCPPTPGEVENAIMVVEDEVMPLHKLLSPKSKLYTLDHAIGEIMQFTVFSETGQGRILLRSDMENVFNRLAAIITGRPASQDILPVTNSFAAILLILREVMHHLGFADITVLS